MDIIDTIYAKHKFEAEKAEREAEAVAVRMSRLGSFLLINLAAAHSPLLVAWNAPRAT